MAIHRPLELTVWFDYHCPYSDRAVAWLLGLGPAPVRPRFRPFPLEQVNRDPTATNWRVWEQPLDYIHHRGHQDRRPLQAFLATAILESGETSEVAERFRLAVYRARFDDGADISDLEVLGHLASAAGADETRLRAAFASETALAPARSTLAEAWRDARSEYAIFGVPTLSVTGRAPFYLRLARQVAPGAEARDLLERLVSLGRDAALVLEIKVPDRVDRGPEGAA